MSSVTSSEDFISPTTIWSKRPTSPIPELERPTKRLQLGPTSSTASTLVDDYPMGVEQENREADDSDEEEAEVIPRRDKGKGKAKMVVVPDLPQEVWSRVFEFLYTGCEDQWNASNIFTGGLTPLVLSKEHTSLAMPVLYRHPHLSHQTIPAFIQSIHTPARYTELTKIQLIKHLTIRPSPAIPGLEPKGTQNRLTQPRPVTGPTIHPQLSDLMQSMPELTSFTLRDALVLESWDAHNLFKALSYINPVKARLEIRMWDLYDSPVGQDLIAANKPSIHAPVTQHITSPPTPLSPPLGTVSRARTDGGTTLMQEAWRESLWKGGELEFPGWWIEPPSQDAPGNGHQAAMAPNPYVVGGGNGFGGSTSNQTTLSSFRQHSQRLLTQYPRSNTSQQNGSNSGLGIIPSQVQSLASQNSNSSTSSTTARANASGPPASFPTGTSSQSRPLGQVAGTSFSNAYAQAYRIQLNNANATAGTRRSARLANLGSNNSTTTSNLVPSVYSNAPNGTTNAGATILDIDVDEDSSDDERDLSPSEVAKIAVKRRRSAFPRVVASARDGSARSMSTTSDTSQGPSANITSTDIPTYAANHSEDLSYDPDDHTTDDPAPPYEDVEPVAELASEEGNMEVETDAAMEQGLLFASWAEDFDEIEAAEEAAEEAEEAEEAAVEMEVIDPAMVGSVDHLTQQPVTGPTRVDMLKDIIVSTTLDIGSDWKAIRRGINAARRNVDIDVNGNITSDITRNAPIASSSTTVLLPAVGGSLPDYESLRSTPASQSQIDRTDHLLEEDIANLSGSSAATVPPPNRDRSLGFGTLTGRPPRAAISVNTTSALAQPGASRLYGSVQVPAPVALNPYATALMGSNARNRSSLYAYSARRIHRSRNRGPIPSPVEADAPSLRAASARDTSLTSYLLAHDMRRLLLDLMTHYWSPRIRALSFVALDPLASMIVRAPLLDLWTRLSIPHIRVHLPRGINSLAVFKGAKESFRDRMRAAAARRAERDAAAAAAADEGGDDDDDADDSNPAPAITPATNPAVTPATLTALHVITNGGNVANANAIPLTLPDPVDEEANRVVGGDGEGGGLLHEDIKLFEIEVNTLAEMGDDVWIYCGNQFPPEVCRLLVGEHDWRDLSTGGNMSSPASNYPPELVPQSPATDDYLSPTFSFASDSEGDEAMSGSEVGGEGGETYDAEAAKQQAKRIAERKRGRMMELAEDGM